MSSEARHQASAILAAFRYQLMQSLAAWLDLAPDETLWLEVSEDFSIAASQGATDVQIKSSAKSLSLRSKDVTDALERFWQRANTAGGHGARLVFISRGSAAQEKGFSFPENVPGLLYWRAAALGADTGPMRQFLSQLFSGKPLSNWLDTEPDDEELRNRLLRPVLWTLEAVDAERLTDDLEDRVAALLLSKGLPVSASNVGSKVLLDHVFETASQKEEGRRKLTNLDLHSAAESVVSPAALELLKRFAEEAGQSLLLSDLGSPDPRLSLRKATVASLIEKTATESLVFIHGANGTGKSTLARLVAADLGGKWLSVDLRPVADEPKATLAVWRELRRRFDNDPDMVGVIIDDLNSQAQSTLQTRLRALADSISKRGGKLLITCAQPPSPARLADMETSSGALIPAPYLTVSEISELVATPPGPDDKNVEAWANLIRVATSGGHPLLVAAKIASLRARGWPTAALVEDLAGPPSDAIVATREEARRRLLDEVPSEAGRELLRRLASIFDRADDNLIRKLGMSDPALTGVGDMLATLRGSWIEVMPDSGLRISPLLVDLKSDVPEDQRSRWLSISARHWASLGELNAKTLPLCFWNAYFGRDISVLVQVANAVLCLPRSTLRSAAALLSPLTAFRTDGSILPEAPLVTPTLRLLQLCVADAIGEGDIASAAAARFLDEVDQVPKDLGALVTAVAGFQVLSGENTKTPPAVLLEYVIRARAAQPILESLGAKVPEHLLGDGDFPGFIFTLYAGTRIQSSTQLLALIRALDNLDKSIRDGLITSFAYYMGDVSALIHGAWAAEQRRNEDGSLILANYEQIVEIISGWDHFDITVESAIALSVIQDEMIDDSAWSLKTIDEALDSSGCDWRLLHQKAKVLAHMGRHADATATLVSAEDKIPSTGFPASLAFREGAMAAAKAKQESDALRFFEKARKSIGDIADFHALAIGLQVEQALLHWRSGNREAALVALADALEQLPTLHPTASRQNERVHLASRQLVFQFWDDLQPYPSKKASLEIGQASALAGDEPLQNLDFKSLHDLWRILANVEIEARLNVGIEERSLAIRSEGTLCSIELFIANSRYCAALVDQDDLARILELGLDALSILQTIKKLGVGARMPPFNGENPDISVALAADFERLQSIAVDIVLSAYLRGKLDGGFLDSLAAAFRNKLGSEEPISPILDAASGLHAVGLAAPTPIAVAYGLSGRIDPLTDLSFRLWRDVNLVAHTAVSNARYALEKSVIEVITSGWAQVIEQQQFKLSNPAQRAPEIGAAIERCKANGLAAVGPLLSAAASAVGVRLAPSWAELFDRLGASGDTSSLKR